jgi:hypothetical protein
LAYQGLINPIKDMFSS